ncbi:hypothetical protein IscW_ISCW013530 [Ixodes scapularis]|uniref:Uncharacterized protein n=1 Tax=Ixodes scapularis TaxID=6945 RepID=B7QLI3_IXOSC|nr:hypothetical protein IscW_ISCW013530 [Ixodes scapularis]|eukprot:XP_002416038.1 hypothetical protein IscW_ISCW013530 [Ixodes scapularis]
MCKTVGWGIREGRGREVPNISYADSPLGEYLYPPLYWTVLLHPPYSLGLTASDFHLSGKMKNGLRSEHFSSHDVVTYPVKQPVTFVCTDFFQHGVKTCSLLAKMHSQ